MQVYSSQGGRYCDAGAMSDNIIGRFVLQTLQSGHVATTFYVPQTLNNSPSVEV